MSGLNPSGLGNTQRFTNAEGESISTESLFTESRGPSVVVHVTDDGTIVADGPANELASGDFNTQADVTTVLQTAIDHGGHVLVKRHSADYVMGVGGQDKEVLDYCLAMKSDTDLEIEEGATLTFPTDTSPTDAPISATPIVASGVDNFRIRGRGTIDAGYHRQPQPDAHDQKYLVLKIGEAWNNADAMTGTGCSHFEIRDITITGGCRHGIEVGAPKGEEAGPGLIDGVTAIDGSGDDDFAIGGPAKHITYRNCVSYEKARSGSWGSSGFEMDDGPKNCYFVNCHCIDPQVSDISGFVIGKMHGWADAHPCQTNHAVNCTVRNAKDGFVVNIASPTGTAPGTVKDIAIINCRAEGCDRGIYWGLFGAAGSFENLRVEGGQFLGGAPTMQVNCQATGSDLKIDTTTDGSTQDPGANININLTGGEIDGLEIDGLHKNSTARSVLIQHFDNTSLVSNLRIGGRHHDNGKTALKIDGVAANYGGLSFIEGCEFWDNNWANAIAFDDPAIRQHVLTRDNKGASDWSPQVPAAPHDSLWYLDDGTNTGTGTLGKRVYDGTAADWFDAWTK